MWYGEMLNDPTRTTRRLYDILVDIGISSADNTLDLVVDGVTLADNALILDLWLRRSEWLYTQSKLQHSFITRDGQQIEIDGGYIIAEWGNFIARNGVNLKRMIDALYSDYNPIENYSMVEIGTDGERRDNTRVTPSGSTTITSTPYVTGINSSGDGAQAGKTETTTTYNDAQSETEYDNTLSADFDGDTKTGYNVASEKFLKRSGNIGVTTSMQMIRQEIDGRRIDLIQDFVDRFFALTCYYVG